MAFIEAQPVLERYVTLAWRLQLAHMMRGICFGGDNLKAPKVKSREWKELYGRLSDLLKRHGRNDAFGQAGDFFLVNDQADEPGHKIELSNPDLLNPALIKDLQAALQGWKNEWYVVVTFEFEAISPDVDPGMMEVWKDHVEEYFDRAQLKSVLGSRFAI